MLTINYVAAIFLLSYVLLFLFGSKYQNPRTVTQRLRYLNFTQFWYLNLIYQICASKYFFHEPISFPEQFCQYKSWKLKKKTEPTIVISVLKVDITIVGLRRLRIPSVIVIQQIMRVTRWIVLPLLTKALQEFGCFEGILQRAKFALLSFPDTILNANQKI